MEAVFLDDRQLDPTNNPLLLFTQDSMADMVTIFLFRQNIPEKLCEA